MNDPRNQKFLRNPVILEDTCDVRFKVFIATIDLVICPRIIHNPLSVVSTLSNALVPESYKLPFTFLIEGFVVKQFCTASRKYLSETNRRPFKVSMNGPNRGKSEKGRSGLNRMFQGLKAKPVDCFCSRMGLVWPSFVL
ncbi:hypothetical protein TNIN_410201 [Trichonephila inaurata madagascariensis]|uniref:Uncharacterized protein n=1 Tax=Trichonephila inaurata madagascariensis TaxID=2747483 RepID=A0A8X6M8W8_9ARAC|nr:hypothetical protein TNIN_410201 [Trichonephila inaurata madagascariensis]